VLEFSPAIEWHDHDKIKQAIYNNTLLYNQALEKMILKKPEQWMWMYKRWKL
jgi:Kdo2-lipid IVA lauroyltransferase/acyltransferase